MKNIKQFRFEAAHKLKDQSLHGHSYKVYITLEGPMNRQTGMVLSSNEFDNIFGRLKEFDQACILNHSDELARYFSRKRKRAPIVQKLVFLNGEPTAGNIARDILLGAFLDVLVSAPQIRKVKVSVRETEDTFASFSWERQTKGRPVDD